jgi:4-hydroxyproline epimerase
MNRNDIQRVQVVDSHTGGEPTRVVIGGGPDLGSGSAADQLQVLRTRYDTFRSAVVNEPRGSDVLVGALLTEPQDRSCAAGVIFFNNVSYLGMCGHGTIGLTVTLAHLGRIEPGEHRIETPVGVVTATLHETGEVSVQNVPSYRHAHNVSVTLEGYGEVTGDIAWGGNWFFLVNTHGQDLSLSNVEQLTEFTWRIRRALERKGITGRNGGEIDHIELFSPSNKTSAKLACLHADGKLKEGEVWRQESIVGSVFEGRIQVQNGELIPTIRGSAYVNAEATLLLDPADPFCQGIR